jgi:hypothetical protein
MVVECTKQGKAPLYLHGLTNCFANANNKFNFIWVIKAFFERPSDNSPRRHWTQGVYTLVNGMAAKIVVMMMKWSVIHPPNITQH